MGLINKIADAGKGVYHIPEIFSHFPCSEALPIFELFADFIDPLLQKMVRLPLFQLIGPCLVTHQHQKITVNHS